MWAKYSTCLVLLVCGKELLANTVPATTPKLSLNPTINSKSAFKDCTTKTGKPGRCVHESYCNKDHELERFGVINFSEHRSAECQKQMEWCCSDRLIKTGTPAAVVPSSTAATTTTNNNEKSCSISNRPDCPWCVNLYRDGDDDYKLDSGFFCMGTLIGSKVVLTTGACMLQAQGKLVWAHVPNSSDPTKDYKVVRRIVHPEFNSGTRAYDLALFVLDNDVQWGSAGPKGACLGVNQPLSGWDCLGAGIDDNENILMTPLMITEGTCGGGSPVDAACGNVIVDECSVMPGAPIMCRVDGSFMVVGVAKMTCRFDPPKALLGNLNVASTWLQSHLTTTLGLTEQEFLHKP